MRKTTARSFTFWRARLNHSNARNIASLRDRLPTRRSTDCASSRPACFEVIQEKIAVPPLMDREFGGSRCYIWIRASCRRVLLHFGGTGMNIYWQENALDTAR